MRLFHPVVNHLGTHAYAPAPQLWRHWLVLYAGAFMPCMALVWAIILEVG